jgi:hypothetical protein
MIVHRDCVEWLEHRAGVARSETAAVLRLQRGLERDDREQIDSFGRREIVACCGYVEAAGWQARMAGRAPREMSDYLTPFFQGVFDAARDCPLRDRLGGRVQLIWPDTFEDNGVRPDHAVGSFVRALPALQERLGAAYPLRAGLAYGAVCLSRVMADGQADWTVCGEALALAEALLSCREGAAAPGFAAAFGVLLREEAPLRRFNTCLANVAGGRLVPRPLPEGLAFPGVGPTRAALLTAVGG